MRSFYRTVRASLGILDSADFPPFVFKFQPLAFDTLGAPAPQLVDIVRHHPKLISFRSDSAFAQAETHIWEKLSLAIWSSVAAAAFARTPNLAAALSTL